MRKIHLVGFLIFLVLYSVSKYQAVPSLMGQASYITSTSILIILTAVAPYALSIAALNGRNGNEKWVLAIGLPLALSALGLATYFHVFIRPNFADISIFSVLPRSLTPGLIMGCLLTLREFLKVKSKPANGAVS